MVKRTKFKLIFIHKNATWEVTIFSCYFQLLLWSEFLTNLKVHFSVNLNQFSRFYSFKEFKGIFLQNLKLISKFNSFVLNKIHRSFFPVRMFKISSFWDLSFYTITKFVCIEFHYFSIFEEKMFYLLFWFVINSFFKCETYFQLLKILIIFDVIKNIIFFSCDSYIKSEKCIESETRYRC